MEIDKITQNTTEESFWDAHTLLNAQRAVRAPDECPESPKDDKQRRYFEPDLLSSGDFYLAP